MSEFAAGFAASQIIGTRERQEDDYITIDLCTAGSERLLFALADGMGGHEGAATVAQIAVRRFCEIVQSFDGRLSERLSRALWSTNDEIAKAAIRDATLEGAGCAFLSAAVEDGTLSWTSVGDCSLFLFRRGKLRRLNEDHSMRPVLAEMVATGRISSRTAALDPRRHSLRSALMGREIRMIDNSLEPLPLNSGDIVILASDGLETLSTRALAKLLAREWGASPARLVDRLLNAVEAARLRSQDNTTLIIYQSAGSEASGRNRTGPGAGRFLLWFALAAIFLCVVAYALQTATP